MLPSRPVLLKGVYVHSAAYKLWDDEYFRYVQSMDKMVFVDMSAVVVRFNRDLQGSIKFLALSPVVIGIH